MSVTLMNDTFDNFAFSQIPVTQTLTAEEIEDKTVPILNKNEVSFDDSFFFTTPISSPSKNSEDISKSTQPTNTSLQLSDSDAEFLALDLNFDQSSTQKNEISQNISQSKKNLPEDTSPSQNPLLQLANWGLPEAILHKYKSRKVTTMFPWQVECLNNVHVLKENSNLVYSAPTSAGKTLVAEIITIKSVIERSKKVIFILPFVSVVREKMFYFQDILGGSGVRVEGFMGSYNPPGGFQSVQVAICTIEKANSLINKLLLEGNISEIGAVIIDEMHLLGDPSRGYLLELLLTKLKYISKRDENVNIQIVGMSATLPNLEVLAKWLKAELYITQFRPIPLQEQAQVCGEIYNDQLKLMRKLEPLIDLETDTDNILQLCLETINDSCSVLIFCPTKNWCENLAQQISVAFWKLGNGKSSLSQQLRNQLNPELIGEVLQQLKFCPVGLDEILRKTISFGVAFHHAGLTMDERDIVENSFRNGVVRVLIATSTLSSGVNLPARRVIIRTPIFHGKPLDTLTYRQMIGRAGRMGKDIAGESILVCQKGDYKIAKNLMSSQLDPIESCLEGDGKLKRALLEIVASGVASSPEDVQLFTQCTLLAQNENVADPIEEALKFLVNNEFLRLQEVDGVLKYTSTSLGKACLSSSIPPEDGLSLFTELEKARQCFVLETELHLIYLVTPYSACYQWGNIDWMFYLNIWEKLPVSMKKVGELVGVRESYLVSATRGKMQTNTSKLLHKLLIHKRFFVALALQDLVDEKPLSEVSTKFNCNRGMLQSLQLSASTFAGMVTAFSRQLGWSSVEILIAQFQDRLQFGVSRDLLDLMRLPILNGKSARALFEGGIETLVMLANSNVDTIESILLKVMPFESVKMREGESEFEVQQRQKFRNIWITGKEGLTEEEAAGMLLENARHFLQLEMGLKEAKWNKTIQEKTIIETPTKEINKIETSSRDNITEKTFLSPSVSINNSLFSDRSLFEDSFSEQLDKSIKINTRSLNSSSDFVATSQDESCVSINDVLLRSAKKRRWSGLELDKQTPKKKLRTFNAFNKLEIVNVCNHEMLFRTFTKEVMKQTEISISVGCSRVEEIKRLIGVEHCEKAMDQKFVYKSCKVDGVALCWMGNVSYYLDFNKRPDCISLFKSLVSKKELIVRMFDSKEQIKALKRCCGVDFQAKIQDPKVADWILEPDGIEIGLASMLLKHGKNSPNVLAFQELLQHCGNIKTKSSIGLHTSDVQSKLRSSIESVITWQLTDDITRLLINHTLHKPYEKEMECLKTIIKMELDGIGINEKTLRTLIETINTQLNKISIKAYSLARRRFSFSSSKEVANVLGIKKTDTTKKILEKNENPLADLIIQWRKLNTLVTKMIKPLIRSVDQNRIYGCYTIFTATGRISMHEPNIQCVAKNFDIPNCEEKITMSVRSAFVPKEDWIFISADYCQLELRLLAHLSQDKILCKIMRSSKDVFRSIAAKWNKISEEKVTPELRQKAKQICYGIIYGMGSAALSQELLIDEKEATLFMETFRNTYPEMKNFLSKIVDDCRGCGYIATLAERRRFFSNINSPKLTLKNQSERQAVNTTIQGSAADLVKNTMCILHERISSLPFIANLVLHLHDELIYEVPKVHLKQFALFMKETMENSVGLSIPFPVKMKCGSTWGHMTDYL